MMGSLADLNRQVISLSLNAQVPYSHTKHPAMAYILPSSAAAFAPREAPTIVLNNQAVPWWLTATLERVNRGQHPLNNITQLTEYLTEILSPESAVWTLCSIMFPKTCEAELWKDENPLVEGRLNYQMIHIKAYVVYVDMISRNDMAFKLTPETIKSLVDFHKEVYCVDATANIWYPLLNQREMVQLGLQKRFVHAVNTFLYHHAGSRTWTCAYPPFAGYERIHRILQ